MDATTHSMTRRAAAHDYCRLGIYHVTLHVAKRMGSPLGKVEGDAEAPDGHPDAPRVVLSPVGRMVEHELLSAIHTRYPMVEVQDHIVMPDHLHALLVVKRKLVNTAGHSTHFGDPLTLPLPRQTGVSHRPRVQGHELPGSGPLPHEGRLVEKWGARRLGRRGKTSARRFPRQQPIKETHRTTHIR